MPVPLPIRNASRAEPGRLRSLTGFPWLPASVVVHEAGVT
jgi:hypothetical protein